MKPLISIIVPCYNQAQYLDECLQSVLNQTYPHWECIIVNDGSPDNTEEVAKKWVEKDSRFKYISQENKGVSAARNFGIRNAEGEWILPLDGDDYISNDYLELAINYFDDANIKVIYCNAKKFGEETGDFILNDFSLKNLAALNLIFCTAFFRKNDWKRIGGFDEQMIDGYEDWEFWINMLKDGGEIKKLDKVCFFYRIKKSSRNVSVKKDALRAIRYLEKKHLNFFYEHLGTLHGLFQENEQNKKVLNVINKRLFSRVVNKIYSVKESLFNNFSKQ